MNFSKARRLDAFVLRDRGKVPHTTVGLIRALGASNGQALGPAAQAAPGENLAHPCAAGAAGTDPRAHSGGQAVL